jgi:hypothetical protein
MANFVYLRGVPCHHDTFDLKLPQNPVDLPTRATPTGAVPRPALEHAIPLYLEMVRVPDIQSLSPDKCGDLRLPAWRAVPPRHVRPQASSKPCEPSHKGNPNRRGDRFFHDTFDPTLPGGRLIWTSAIRGSPGIRLVINWDLTPK